MLDIEKTNSLKRKLESMKSSDKPALEESRKKIEKGISSLLTIILRVTFIYFAQSIIFQRYSLGAPFAYWETFIVYWGLGAFIGLFKTSKE